MRARIDNGRVAEVLSAAPFPEFHPALVWVDAPPDVRPGWWYTDGQFTDHDPEIDNVRASKLAELSAACEALILSGFHSDTLGAPRLYPYTDRDQMNLHVAVLDAAINADTVDWATPLMCADAAGAWSYVMHSPAQTIAVGDAANAFRIAALMKNARLAQCVAEAATIDEINAIGWDK
ncbi:hypothetical protein G3A43_40580 [Paraburkholderia aspalathi]|uniref:DUF4376 domain-containing protein n=1 Tax=Paraburkholderia nemoris TaxID=2793076 RepID=UPI00190E462D|nr:MULTISPECIES: hypothetical protein [Paraburkholderia]MBK3786499.1 hypothetical protein [Paraburkholderia aspalathi]